MNSVVLTSRVCFLLQFLVSEVKGLHHSLSCVALIFISIFAVQMLVSKK